MSVDHVVEWKTVPGSPLHQASTTGLIRSWAFRGGSVGGLRADHPKILKGCGSKDGYRRVTLNKKTMFVHSVVAETFHGPRPPGGVCRHLDGSRINNRPDNLRWGTPAENSADRVRHGRSGGQKGESAPWAKLTAEAVQHIRLSKESAPCLAAQYGVCRSTIQAARSGKSWGHIKAIAAGGAS